MRDKNTPDLFDIAWAAGLFEGEGWFTYGRPNSVAAGLNMTDFEAVERFHAIVGVGRTKPKSRGKNPSSHWKPGLLWLVTDRAGVQHVLETLRPWLGPRRVARGEEVLRLQAEFTEASKRERDAVCANGHRRTPTNTEHLIHSVTGRPYKRCKTCARAWKAAHR